MDASFSQFSAILQKNLEANDTSFESPKIELLESGKKLSMASLWGWPIWPQPINWKNITFTETPFGYSFYQRVENEMVLSYSDLILENMAQN